MRLCAESNLSANALEFDGPVLFDGVAAAGRFFNGCQTFLDVMKLRLSGVRCLGDIDLCLLLDLCLHQLDVGFQNHSIPFL